MSTTSRGYGYEHQQLRKELLADLARSPGQLCHRCRQPMFVSQALDLGHTDDRSGYLGLEHANQCNRAAAARRGNKMRGRPRRPRSLFG